MDRRTFLSVVAWAAVPGGAGLRPLLAQPLGDNVVIAEVDLDTEILAWSAMTNGGAALLLGSMNEQPTSEIASAELAHFSAAGVRLASVPVPASLGPLRIVAKNVALDRNGALWVLRPRAGLEAEASAGARNLELGRLAPGEPLKIFPLPLPASAMVTAMECESGAVWCAVNSNSGTTVLRFDTASHAALARTLADLGIYRFFRADAGYLLAASGRLGPSREHDVTTSVYALDDSLRTVASATIEGWIQDVAYTAAAGSAPAMLHLAAAGGVLGSRLLSVETLAFPDLQRVWAQTWSEPEQIVPGSAFFVKANHAQFLVRVSSSTQQVLCSALEPRAQERVLPMPQAPRKLYRAYPLRGSASVRYLLVWFLFANGRWRRRIALSPNLTMAVKG